MSTFTDTDLTVLEGLDSGFPCTHAECSAEAEWVAYCPKSCGCVGTPMRCTTCIRLIHEDVAYLNVSAIRCERCGSDLPPGSVTIDRIEAL